MRHGTVTLIHQGHKLLVSERLAGANGFVGRWAPPGGHALLGESLLEAAVREVKEETGIPINQMWPVYWGNTTHAGADGDPTCCHIFSVYVPPHVNAENKEPNKHGPWAWADWDQFSALLKVGKGMPALYDIPFQAAFYQHCYVPSHMPDIR